jgi:hypothetical protein
MTATKALIGFPRVTDEFTLSGGSWDADYPLANLQALPLSRVARSVDLNTANTLLIATAAGQVRVGLIALCRHNLSLSAGIRLRCWYDVARTSLAYDSGSVAVWPEVYPYDQIEWEDLSFWTGTYSSTELLDTAWTRFFDLGRDYLVAAIEIDITDPTNGDGYVQAGFLEIAARGELAVNFEFGAQYGFRFRSTSIEATGGSLYFNRKPKPRRFIGSVKYDTRNEALSRHYERLRQFDLVTPFLWVPNADEAIHLQRTVFLARNLDPGYFTYASASQTGLRDTVPIALEEVIG